MTHTQHWNNFAPFNRHAPDAKRQWSEPICKPTETAKAARWTADIRNLALVVHLHPAPAETSDLISTMGMWGAPCNAVVLVAKGIEVAADAPLQIHVLAVELIHLMLHTLDMGEKLEEQAYLLARLA